VNDDKTDTHPAIANRINIDEDYEIRYWTKELGASEDELRAAVNRVGVMAADVHVDLGRKH